MRRQVHDTGVDDRRRVVGAAGLESRDRPLSVKRDADATCHVTDSMGHKPDRHKGIRQAPAQAPDAACHSPDTAGRFAEHNISTTAESPPDLRAVVEAWPGLSPETRARIVRIAGKRGGRGDE